MVRGWSQCTTVVYHRLSHPVTFIKVPVTSTIHESRGYDFKKSKSLIDPGAIELGKESYEASSDRPEQDCYNNRTGCFCPVSSSCGGPEFLILRSGVN